LFDVHAFDAFPEVVPIDIIAVADHVPRSFIERKGLDDLLSCPLRGGIGGDIEVNHLPAIVPENDEAVEHTKRCGRHGKEVDGRQVWDVVIQKRPPILRWRFPGAYQILGDSSFGHNVS